MTSPKTSGTFGFSKRAMIISGVYAAALLAVNLWMIEAGVLKGALLGKLSGLFSIVSLVFVFYISHPKDARGRLSGKDGAQN
jgi:hypothetical protein